MENEIEILLDADASYQYDDIDAERPLNFED